MEAFSLDLVSLILRLHKMELTPSPPPPPMSSDPHRVRSSISQMQMAEVRRAWTQKWLLQRTGYSFLLALGMVCLAHSRCFE